MADIIIITKDGEEVFKGIASTEALVLKDGTKQYGSHHGWPFLATKLREEGKLLDRVAYEVVAFNKETEQFEYTEDINKGPYISLKDLGNEYQVIPCMTV